MSSRDPASAPPSLAPACLLLGLLAVSACAPPPEPKPPLPAPAPPVSSTLSLDVRTMLVRARSLLDTGAWDESADLAGRALTADATNHGAREIFLEANYRRGVGWLEGGIFDKAIASFERVMLMDPGYRDTIELKEQARRKLAKLIDRLYKEGILLYRQKRLDEALDKWNEVLRLEPAHEETRKFREKALQLLEKLRQMDME